MTDAAQIRAAHARAAQIRAAPGGGEVEAAPGGGEVETAPGGGEVEAAPRILIAGVGNIFFGDDGFGVETARRLALRPWPEGVRVGEYGIRGLDLAFAMLDGCDAAILIDAAPRGLAAGTVSVFVPEIEASGDPEDVEFETHNLDPVKVLRLARVYGPLPGRIFVVACEPADLGDADGGRMGLSPPVAAAVEEAMEVVGRLVGDLTGGGADAACA